MGLIDDLLAAPHPDPGARLVVEVTWGTGDLRIDQRQFPVGRTIRVGTPRWPWRAVDVVVPGLSAVVLVWGDEVVVPDGWAARVVVSDLVLDGIARVPLGDETRVVVWCGPLWFFVRLAPAAERIRESCLESALGAGIPSLMLALHLCVGGAALALHQVASAREVAPLLETWQVQQDHRSAALSRGVRWEEPWLPPDQFLGRSSCCMGLPCASDRAREPAAPPAARPVPADLLVVGGIEPRRIDEVVRRKQFQIRYCYQREQRKDPSLRGKLVIQFTIAEDGRVARTRVSSSTIGSESVGTCVAKRFDGMVFPPPAHGIAIVRYPLVFDPPLGKVSRVPSR